MKHPNDMASHMQPYVNKTLNQANFEEIYEKMSISKNKIK